MLDVRVYRAAFIPALLAIFVVAFSLQGRPTPVRTRAVADAFDPSRAYGSERLTGSLLQLGSAFPERDPGSAGDDALADRVAASLRGSGFDVDRTERDGRAMGLFTMRERVGLLNGSVDIASTPETGTSVFVRLPIAATPASSVPAAAHRGTSSTMGNQNAR